MTTRPPARSADACCRPCDTTAASASSRCSTNRRPARRSILPTPRHHARSERCSAGGHPPPEVSSTVPAVAEQPQQTPTTCRRPATPHSRVPPQLPRPRLAAASGACEGKTIDGPVVDTRWGPVQVEAVVSANGQICDVDAIQSPDSHGRSVRINQQALPILHTQVMKAQEREHQWSQRRNDHLSRLRRSLQSILDNVG